MKLLNRGKKLAEKGCSNVASIKGIASGVKDSSASAKKKALNWIGFAAAD